jgi:hypothetical protein
MNSCSSGCGCVPGPTSLVVLLQDKLGNNLITSTNFKIEVGVVDVSGRFTPTPNNINLVSVQEGKLNEKVIFVFGIGTRDIDNFYIRTKLGIDKISVERNVNKKGGCNDYQKVFFNDKLVTEILDTGCSAYVFRRNE